MLDEQVIEQLRHLMPAYPGAVNVLTNLAKNG